jgi:hypothetical protein
MRNQIPGQGLNGNQEDNSVVLHIRNVQNVRPVVL